MIDRMTTDGRTKKRGSRKKENRMKDRMTKDGKTKPRIRNNATVGGGEM
jgi:hypothetical protein